MQLGPDHLARLLRFALALFGLALTGAGLWLTLGIRHGGPANAGAPAVDFSISAPGCNSSGTPAAKCGFPLSTVFTVTFSLNAQPPGGWSGYDMDILYSGSVTYKAGSLQQAGAGVWPNCAFPTGEGGFDPGEAFTACANNTGVDQSYTGVLAKLNFTCSPSAGQATLTLVAGNTDLVSATGTQAEASNESLTINCLAPTSTVTNTPTRTNTPTHTPTNTRTFTPTNTATNTPTSTATRTNTPTATNTGTPANTPTITNTPTNTRTPTNTNTPTNTITPGGPTLTPSNTPTATRTPTPGSATPTSTATGTAPAPSATPTATLDESAATLTPTATGAIPTNTPTPTPTQTPAPDGLVGDANKNGRVTAVDALLVLQDDAGIIPPVNPRADANHNGRIDVVDAALILQLDAGIISALA